ncbi:Hypothetical predicted protein, partial [Olea europaea subsp. europaea]
NLGVTKRRQGITAISHSPAAGGGGCGILSNASNVGIVIAVTAMAGLALAATLFYSR